MLHRDECHVIAVEKTFRFEAAHRLVHHDGKCARLHGHSWVATVRFEGAGLTVGGPKDGMILDFGDIAAVVRPIIDAHLDHHFLNETLDTDSPTSEFVATWLYQMVEESRIGATLRSVSIEETCSSRATYEGPK